MFKKIKIFTITMIVALSTAALPMSAFADTPLVDGGVYVITSRLVGKAMEVYDASTLDGAGVDNWDLYYGNNQRWRAVLVDGSYYKFINYNSGKVLEVPGGTTGWGVQLQQWSWNGGDNQKWELVYADATTKHKFYHIRNKETYLCADIYGASTDNGAWIVQWERQYHNNQEFTFTRVG